MLGLRERMEENGSAPGTGEAKRSAAAPADPEVVDRPLRRRCRFRYPSMRTIAKRAGYSRKTVQAAKRALRDQGLLEWEVRGRKHVYWFPDPEDRDPSILS